MAGGNGYNFLIVFFVALGSFTYGYNSAIIGSVYGLPSFFEHFQIDLKTSRGNQITGATNGLFAGGGMIGCLIVPWLADTVGRKRAVQMIAILCIISAIVQGASVHIAMFLVGRFFNGIGVGMIDVVVPIYQSEVSPAKTRGRMVGSHGFLIVCGYALASWTGLGCFFEKNPAVQWRSFFALWKSKSLRTRLLYGFFVQCIAQSTGVLVVNNYQVLLYSGLGLNGWLPLLLYGLYNSWAAFMNWVNSMVLDRFGGIRIMVVGLIGCALSMCCETAMVATYGGTNNKIGNGSGVFFLFSFVTFYGGCLDASSYVYCAEIFPTWMRAQGVGFSVMGLFASTLLYTQVAPVAFAEVGWRYYLVFIIVPLAGVGILGKYFPETTGLSLEEIGVLFGDEVVVDIGHMTLEERAALDGSLVLNAKTNALQESKGEQNKEVEFMERSANDSV